MHGWERFLDNPKAFDAFDRRCYKFWAGFSRERGAVAQLGARLDGIEEVEGSNPFGSTIIFPELHQ
jgi:hypothetical protein